MGECTSSGLNVAVKYTGHLPLSKSSYNVRSAHVVDIVFKNAYSDVKIMIMSVKFCDL